MDVALLLETLAAVMRYGCPAPGPSLTYSVQICLSSKLYRAETVRPQRQRSSLGVAIIGRDPDKGRWRRVLGYRELVRCSGQ
jgi:hypothetical protein